MYKEKGSYNFGRQTPFIIQNNKDFTSDLIWARNVTKCRVNVNQTLHIELERLSRVSEIGINGNAIRFIQGKFSCTNSRIRVLIKFLSFFDILHNIFR